MIRPPRHPTDYPDRLLNCEEALEPTLHRMMGLATAAGWTPKEIRRAIRRLVGAHKCTEEDVAKLEADLAIIRAMERAKS